MLGSRKPFKRGEDSFLHHQVFFMHDATTKVVPVRPVIRREVKTVLPSSRGNFTLLAYSSNIDNEIQIALVRGNPSTATTPVLVRIHSECLTGDLFRSLRCDCGVQLDAALEKIASSEHGILIYLRQEGRSIGLLNKLRAYELQDAGYDTVEANEMMGFAADARDYTIAALILKDLGVSNVFLLTNNPNKVNALKSSGITVARRISIEISANPYNIRYLQAKKNKLGHLLHGVTDARDRDEDPNKILEDG